PEPISETSELKAQPPQVEAQESVPQQVPDEKPEVKPEETDPTAQSPKPEDPASTDEQPEVRAEEAKPSATSDEDQIPAASADDKKDALEAKQEDSPAVQESKISEKVIQPTAKEDDIKQDPSEQASEKDEAASITM